MVYRDVTAGFQMPLEARNIAGMPTQAMLSQSMQHRSRPHHRGHKHARNAQADQTHTKGIPTAQAGQRSPLKD